jgi:hypothetical protein
MKTIAARAMHSKDLCDLIEGYFHLRNESVGLKEQGSRFEGLFWRHDGDEAVRESGGYSLTVYRREGRIEACVKSPDGTFSTYS